MERSKGFVFQKLNGKERNGFTLHHFPRNKRRDLVRGLSSKNMKNGAGFTLIELLVVAAVIGLLAALVLVSAAVIRDRGKDGAIVQELSQVRQVSQLILAQGGSYSDLCDGGTLNNSNSDLNAIEIEVRKYNGAQPVVCYANANTYCVRSPMNLTNGFCVDSTGQATTSKPNCDTDRVCEP